MGWLNRESKNTIDWQRKFKFAISEEFIDEVECDVVLINVYKVIFRSPYLWDRDAKFWRRPNQYWLVKEGQGYIITAKGKPELVSLISATQAKRLGKAS